MSRGTDDRTGLAPASMAGATWAVALAATVATAIAGGGDGMTVTNRQAATSAAPALESAMFGSGCFWCAEAVFQRREGVKSVVSGYAGGATKNPSYREVCSGETGHAEVVRVEFDPAVVTYGELLDLFWQMHDPTTPNRQGADVGTQYRAEEAGAEGWRRVIGSCYGQAERGWGSASTAWSSACRRRPIARKRCSPLC